VANAAEWYRTRRPELLKLWNEALGKTEPNETDRTWFGDISKAVIKSTEERAGYTRIDLDIPIETDFLQHHLLLIPKGQGPGPFPAVIAWAASSGDYRDPEGWWGEYLASNGYVVLSSWSLMRNYRNGTTSRSGAPDLLYQRFGRWLPIARMAYDIRRQAQYLKTCREVDGSRIGFIGFSHSGKAAVYAGAFAPEIQAVVSVDPHIAINGGTNYYDPWYLNWQRRFDDIRTEAGTVQSLLNPDPERPGFERDHHELLAMTAPRPFLLIGGDQSEGKGGHSDDLQSWGYFNRAKEVYEFLGIGERLQFASTNDGHKANGPNIDPAWKSFFERWLKETPVGFTGWQGKYGPPSRP
jgi:dienelactone hydrolase